MTMDEHATGTEAGSGADRAPAPHARPPLARSLQGDWPAAVLAVAGFATLLRLVLLLGRGDYIAFDEGFYLLLGRSLVTGDGYSLVGIPHTALSPLFPILAGTLGRVIDSWIWGGRIVSAVAGGLLVLPAWAIFRRLAPRRTALIAAALIAVLPSLAPFVVPFWIGADLWVGAEPLLHLLLYAGVAAWLWADEREGIARWAVPGALLGLAFLARPESIMAWGLLGLLALALAARHRSPRRVAGALLMGLAFLLVCSPYWLYLRDVTGRWSLTGRGVAPASAAVQAVLGTERRRSASTIERMLWGDDESYQQRLYALDPTGLRLAQSYWGVYQTPPADTVATDTFATAAAPALPARSPRAPSGQPEAPRPPEAPSPPSTLSLYLQALGRIFPLLLWPFVILGLAQPRSRAILRRELPVTLSLLGTSVAIAALVAVDPRTQLLLVPLLAFYAARGFSLIEQQVQRHARGGGGERAGGGTGVRPGMVELLLAVIAVVWLLGINGQRLYRSLVLGSPHHIVAEQNRAVAERIDTLLDDGAGPVMSWHPALAVFADRDWRVLPFADLPGIIRYAGASGAGVIVLSAYYPPDLGVESAGIRYLLMPVPPDAVGVDEWTLRIEPVDSIRGVGRLEAADGG